MVAKVLSELKFIIGLQIWGKPAPQAINSNWNMFCFSQKQVSFHVEERLPSSVEPITLDYADPSVNQSESVTEMIAVSVLCPKS